MKKIIVLLWALFSFHVLALSATDEKYSAENPQLFELLNQAQQLLNSWRGRSEVLNKAENLLSKIIATDDEFAPAYREYGRLLIMSAYKNNQHSVVGLLYSAESVINYSIELEPGYADAYVLLGHLYTKLHRYSAAKVALEKASELGTSSPWLHNNWANFYMDVGNPVKAMEHFEKVAFSPIQNAKAKISAVRGLAKIYARNGHHEKAKVLYEQAIQLEPHSAWAWGNYAGQLLFVYGDIDDAIIKAEKALSIMDYGLARLTLASAYCTKWAQGQLNDSTETSQYLQKALSVVPNTTVLIDKTVSHVTTNACASELRRYLKS